MMFPKGKERRKMEKRGGESKNAWSFFLFFFSFFCRPNVTLLMSDW